MTYWTAGPRETNGAMRRLARLVAVLVSVFIAAGVAAGAAAHPRTASGAGIAFTDASGHLRSTPVISADGAYPGMSRDTVVRLRNVGSVRETFDVSASVATSGTHSLDEVLVVTVTDPASGSVVYQGRLSTLTFHSSRALAPSRTARYTVQISWPETGRDDLYQGLGLSFVLHADARAA